MKKLKEETKGITLIALVVTIIVLLILSGIAITLTVGNNGLIKRARDAKKMHEVGKILENLEIEKSHIQIDKNGDTSIEKYLNHLIEEEIIGELDIENIEDEEKSKYITVDDKYVFLVEEEEDGNIKITYEGEMGKSEPKLKIYITSIKSSTITVKVTASMMKNGEYEYYINDLESGEGYKLKKTGKVKEYTFTGLTQNKEYKVKVVARNENGETIKESGIIRTIALENLTQADIIFEYNPTGWTKEMITVTAKLKKEVPQGTIVQTSKNAKDWDDTVKQEFTENGVMYVRLYDGINESSYGVAEVSKIDKKEPQIIEITSTSNSITIKGEDEESGIAGYLVSQTPTQQTLDKFTNVNNTQNMNVTVNNLNQGTTYYVWIKDSVGNVSEVKNIATKIITGKVTILTTEEGVEKVEVQVTAETTDGQIKTIEPLTQGVTLKTNTSASNKIFEITKNGKHQFKIITTTGSSLIVETEEIKNIIEVIDADSILDGVSKITDNGIKRIRVKGKDSSGKQETTTYSVNVVYVKGNVTFNGTSNVVGVTPVSKKYSIGSQSDCGTETENAKNTIVLKVEGNITINSGVTLTSVANNSGYGGPKGMVIYCTGTFTNNGVVTMTARGAKAVGENVYLWKNSNGSFEYVPAVGGTGGEAAICPKNSSATAKTPGGNGVGRSSGGGASGNAKNYLYASRHLAKSGAGTSGTSYSGGTGGAGVTSVENNYIEIYGNNGKANGGAGGSGHTNSGGITGNSWSGAGAGNPSGGTGGLLIIYSQNFQTAGTIESKGSEGVKEASPHYSAAGTSNGGDSGGGSINIFYNQKSSELAVDNITAEGAGKGGNGTVTIGSINSSGSFIKD